MAKYIVKIYQSSNNNTQFRLVDARIPFALPKPLMDFPKTQNSYIQFSNLISEMKINPDIQYIFDGSIVEFDTVQDLSEYKFVISNIRSCGKTLGSYIFEFQKTG